MLSVGALPHIHQDAVTSALQRSAAKAINLVTLFTYFHQPTSGAPTFSMVYMWGFDGTVTEAHCHPEQGPQLIMSLPRLTLFTASRIPQRKSESVARIGRPAECVFESTCPSWSSIPSRCANSCAAVFLLSAPRVL